MASTLRIDRRFVCHAHGVPLQYGGTYQEETCPGCVTTAIWPRAVTGHLADRAVLADGAYNTAGGVQWAGVKWYLKGIGESGDIGMQLSVGVLQHAPLLLETVQGNA